MTNDKLSTAPDGGWGWMVVLGSFMVHVIADGITYSYGVLAVDFIDQLEASRQQIGWIGSIMVGTTLGAGPISSMLSKRFGFRLVGVIGSLMASVGFGLTYFAVNIWFVFLTVGFITGAGLGLLYLPAIVCVGHYFDKRRSFAMGLAVCGSGVGTFIFAWLVETLAEEYAWQGAVLILSGIMLNCIICSLLFRPLNTSIELEPTFVTDSAVTDGLLNNSAASPSPEQRYIQSLSGLNSLDGRSDSASISPSKVARSLMNVSAPHMSSPHLYITSLTNVLSNQREEEEHKEPLKTRLRNMVNLELLMNPVFALFLISNFLTSIGFNAPFMYVPDRAIQMGIGRSRASFLVSVIGIANTAGRVIFGVIGNVEKVNRLQLYNISLILCGLATVLSNFCVTYPLMIIYTSVFGLFIGVYVTLTSVVLVDLLGIEMLNSSFGITLLFQGAAVLVGAPLAGYIFDQTNTYDPSFWVCGGMIALSGVMLLPLRYVERLYNGKMVSADGDISQPV